MNDLADDFASIGRWILLLCRRSKLEDTDQSCLQPSVAELDSEAILYSLGAYCCPIGDTCSMPPSLSVRSFGVLSSALSSGKAHVPAEASVALSLKASDRRCIGEAGPGVASG
jgi:hypothetical protein